MKKRIISILLAACMLLTMLPMTAVAAVGATFDYEISVGSSQYSWTFKVLSEPADGNPGTVQIGVAGVAKASTTITGALTIPSQVESGGKTYTVTKIGEYAFYGYSGLSGDLTIPNTVTTIAEYAFTNCTGFTGNLTIPGTVTSIGERAFYGCTGFTGNLTIPSGVTSIGAYAFYGCNKLSGSLTIPDTVTTIGEYAFNGCSGFTGNLTISSGVTSIRESTFYNCTGFTGNLTIPSGVTSIGKTAFASCSGFTALQFGAGSVLTSIDMSAFAYCSGFTGDLTIPSGVTSIGLSAFYECSGFTGNLTFPGTVTSIGNSAFYGCIGFKGNLTISPGVTSIGQSAFYECSGFTGNLTIPSGVTSIGAFAFFGCSGFTGNLTIPGTVTTIGEYAFRNCSGFTGNLTIESGVTSFGQYAFASCSGFTGNLTIPDTVTTIGNHAFSSCNKLSGNLTIPSGVTAIEEYAFAFCSGLTGNLTIPSGVTSIGQYAFAYCSGFAGNLTIPDTVTTIGQYAFASCSKLSGNLTIPSGVTSIGQATFYRCSGFTGNLTIPSGVTVIGQSAFYDCQPDSVTLLSSTAPSVESSSFNGTYKIIIPEGGTGYDAGNWTSYSSRIEALVSVAATPVITHDLSTTQVEYNQNATAAALDATATVTDGGTISYEWYSNTTSSTAGAISLGVTTATYTPSTAATGTTYYYCVVTNTNNAATETKTAQVTSAIANIKVNTMVNAESPVITHDLSTTQVEYNQDVAATALDASASVNDGGTISYQWYSNTTNSIAGATSLGVTTATYTPSTAAVGTTYYYCVVTNTNNAVNGAKTAQATSAFANIKVNALVNAESPVIALDLSTTQVVYNHNSAAVALNATATVSDGGNISYAWYSNTTNSTTGATPLGVITATYTPSTSAAGTTYYYCVVTNTKSDATGNQTAHTTSSIANIKVLAPNITEASVTITAPVVGAVPQNATAVQEATNNADFTVTGLIWNEALTEGSKFKAGQVYTATVTLTSKNGKKFQDEAFTPTVAGSASVGTTTTAGGAVVGNTVSFIVTYAATGALEVSSIAITTQPTKMSYTETTDAVLALNGMKVTETNNDGSTNVVTFTDGTATGYSANPANGTTLTRAIHNGNPVVITHTASGKTANAGNITVAPAPGGGGSDSNSTIPVKPIITVSEVKAELFSNAKDIKVEADVSSAFGQSVAVKITDIAESQKEIFSLTGTNDIAYPFDISLISTRSGEKVQPKEGYSVKITLPVPEKLLGDREKIKVVYGRDGKLETLKSELIEKDGKWYISFEAIHFSPYALIVSKEQPIKPWTNPFSDVEENNWFYSAVQYAAQNGLMNGTSSNTFSPGIATSRGMIATILYSLSGSKETEQSTFKDVSPSAYYATAIAWAQKKGIIAGYGNEMFGPDDSITREQVATILWKYSGSPEATDSNVLAAFKDAGEVSLYAKNAMAWANQIEIINGKGNGLLDPKGKATRAEVAQIIQNFIQKTGLIK